MLVPRAAGMVVGHFVHLGFWSYSSHASPQLVLTLASWLHGHLVVPGAAHPKS